MAKVWGTLGRLIASRRILMRPAYWAAFGTLLIPTGVILTLVIDNWALWLILAGVISWFLGWVNLVMEESRKDTESDLRIRPKNKKGKDN
jgi:hypothetical protein